MAGSKQYCDRDRMQAAGKLMADVLGNCHETNYFIIDELNPDAWGYDGIPMTTKRRMNEQ